MRRVWQAVLLSAVTLLPSVASAQQAPKASIEQRAKNLEEAKSRYAQGLKLYDDGAFDAARVQFERAYELAPSHRILYNIGLVYRQLNDFVGSLKALEAYLVEGGADIPEDRKAEVKKIVSELKGIVATATVAANVPGVEVAVDDLAVGTAPLAAPLLLNPGKRKISGKLAGHLPDAKVITVASGDKVTVELNLIEPPKTIVKTGSDVAPIVSWSVTGVLAAGAGVTAYLTSRAQKSLNEERNNPKATAGSLDDAASQLKTGALVTDILMGGTIVAAGVSVYLTWFRSKGQPDKLDVEKHAGSRSFTNNLAFDVGPSGAIVRGRF